ncbi:membrane associated rhomboid family serine protease [Balneicella halophila]|uniref:Membrane associated rhomboid family serine protease n=2 Tax=Balneicella halophila TaxID=1537566 RepID=A0A7L4US07_BALHA|nr:membrane associated rhomboid family serine protease [Balneicella halophila]
MMFQNYRRYTNPFTQQFQQEVHRKDLLSQIIGINVFVFLLITISGIFFFLAGIKENPIVRLLSVPSSFDVFLRRPWGIITYMFTHKGLFHLLFNMLLLFWMGKLFVKYFDTKKLLWIYIGGGIGGALLYMLAYNYLPVFATANPYSFAIGASASVMAIFFAVALYNPSYSIYLLFIGRIKMLHLAIAFIALDLLMLPGSNPGGHISHLGGALVGVLFALWMKQQPQKFSQRKAQTRTTYKHAKDFQYNAAKKQEEEYINEILDKISKSGYESLTAKERKALFKSSYKK